MKTIKEIVLTITKTVIFNNIEVDDKTYDLISELQDEQSEYTADDVVNLDKSKHEALDNIMKIASKADKESDQIFYFGVEINELETLQ